MFQSELRGVHCVRAVSSGFLACAAAPKPDQRPPCSLFRLPLTRAGSRKPQHVEGHLADKDRRHLRSAAGMMGVAWVPRSTPGCQWALGGPEYRASSNCAQSHMVCLYWAAGNCTPDSTLRPLCLHTMAKFHLAVVLLFALYGAHTVQLVPACGSDRFVRLSRWRNPQLLLTAFRDWWHCGRGHGRG